MLSWDDFRYVKAIADTRTLAGAATELSVNHSTVFRRLALIEQQLGSRLFERSRSGYALTPCGEEMVRLAERMGEDIVAFERQVTGHDLRPSGELRVTTKGPRALRLPPIRHAVIHWLPFPKGAPTAPELLARRATDCRAECAELKHLLERVGAMEGAREWPEHPAFGRMNSRDWGTLVHRHVDHHLRQFGA